MRKSLGLWLLPVLLSSSLLLVPTRLAAQDETPVETPLPTTAPLPEPPVLATPTGSAEATPTADGAVSATPTSTTADDEEPTRRLTSTPEPTLRVDERPDGAEPNNRREQARPLPLDAVSGPFTFLPEGDQDWFSVDLGKEPTGLPLEIAVRGTAGLDLVTTIYTADQWTPLAIIASPDISTTLPADLTGWLLIKVDNRSPELASAQSYRIEVRRTLPPPPTPLPSTIERPELLPDPLENNWSFATAAPVGVGASYDLNFVCPDPQPDACEGGDHDYLRLTVKAGLRYLITTYDLAPGVDTVLDLYFGSEAVPLATSDDERSQGGLLSTLRWVAPADGEAVIRVAPRTGGLQPWTFEEDMGSYRLAIALADTPLADELEARIAEQTNAPTPTPTPTAEVQSNGVSPPITGYEPYPPLEPTPLPMGEARDGTAVVVVPDTALRNEPRADAEVLETLPQEAIVTLLGQVSGAWVKAETDTGVAPGWVYAPDLRRIAETPTPDAALLPTTDAALPSETSATNEATPELQLVPLDPLPPPTAVPPLPREAVGVTVQLVAAQVQEEQEIGSTPTAALETTRLLGGVRVQLVTAFGDLLTEALTDASGRVTLTTERDAGVAVRVRVPAAGIEAVVDPASPTVRIAVPVAADQGDPR
jgi:hypothetical protein